MVNAHLLDASYHYLRVNSLMVKESSNSRINSRLLTSAQLPFALTRAHLRPTGQLAASSHSFSPCSCWRAARRNKLETKESHGHPSWLHRQHWLWVSGWRQSRNQWTNPDLLIGQFRAPPREGLDTDSASTEKRYSLADRRTLQSCTLEIQWGHTGHGWRAEVSFLPGALGFKVKSS